MPNPVVIKFATMGIPDVHRGIDTIEKAMVRLERSSTTAARAGSTERVSSAKREMDAREKEYAKLEKSVEREEAKALRAKIKAGDDAIKNAEKVQKAEEKAAERGEAQKQRIRETSARAHARYLDQEVAAEERAEAKKQRVRETSARAHARYLDQQAAAADRAAALVARTHAAEARATASAGKKMANVFGGAAVNATGRVMGGMVNMASMAATVGGTVALGDVLRDRFASEARARQIMNIVSAGNGGAAPAGASMADLMSRSGAISAQTGIDRKDVLAGGEAYARNAKGGDYAGLTSLLPTMSKLSKISGASMAELGEAAGVIKSQNEKATPAQLAGLLRNVYAQSASGEMGLVDAAKQFGTLGSTAPYYKGDQLANQTNLLALGQFARSMGDTGEAGTFVKDIATEMGSANKKYRKQTGHNLVHVDETTGKMDDVRSVIEQVFTNTKGNISEIGSLLGQRGSRVFTALAPIYQEASAKAGGGKSGGAAGVDAVMKAVDNVAGSTLSEAGLNKAFEAQMQDSGEKMDRAVARLKVALGDSLVPVIDRLVAKLPELIPEIERIIEGGGKLAEWFLNNPFTGIGVVVSGAIAKDVGNAGIGIAIKALLTEIIAGANAGGVAGAARGALKGGGLAGSVVGGTAFYGALAASGVAAGISAQEGTMGGADAAMQMRLRANHVMHMIRDHQMTPEEGAKEQDRIERVLSSAQENSGVRQAALAGFSAPLALVGGKDARGNIAAYNSNATIAGEADSIKAELKGLAQAISDAKKDISRSPGGKGPVGVAPRPPIDPSQYLDIGNRGGSSA